MSYFTPGCGRTYSGTKLVGTSARRLGSSNARDTTSCPSFDVTQLRKRVAALGWGQLKLLTRMNAIGLAANKPTNTASPVQWPPRFQKILKSAGHQNQFKVQGSKFNVNGAVLQRFTHHLEPNLELLNVELNHFVA